MYMWEIMLITAAIWAPGSAFLAPFVPRELESVPGTQCDSERLRTRRVRETKAACVDIFLPW